MEHIVIEVLKEVFCRIILLAVGLAFSRCTKKNKHNRKESEQRLKTEWFVDYIIGVGNGHF